MYVLPVDDLITLAQSRVTRGLTAEECQTYLPGQAVRAAGWRDGKPSR
jgi:hypothetical protein